LYVCLSFNKLDLKLQHVIDKFWMVIFLPRMYLPSDSNIKFLFNLYYIGGTQINVSKYCKCVNSFVFVYEISRPAHQCK
jgi:hypothetical protein